LEGTFYSSVNTTIPDAEKAVLGAFSRQGFGLVSRIDMGETLRAKVGLDIPGYLILGMCNPKLASQAVTVEPHIGVMLPCNVLLRETASGVEILAQDPRALMALSKDRLLDAPATEAAERIEAAMAEISAFFA
jgi:uncharacterized protein (DUF302 family)